MAESAQSELEIASVIARARTGARAFRSASQVLDVLDLLLPANSKVATLRTRRDDVVKGFSKLTLLDPESATFGQVLEALDREVGAIERALVEIDSEIPMQWFREHFNATAISNDAVADYAAVLGRYAGENELRLDRVQLILTRLVTSFLGTGPERHAGPAATKLLMQALPPLQLSPEKRARAVEFLRTSAAQVRGFKELDSLTKSGFLVDTRGFKLSLRSDILDPEVMAAAIELNDAASETIDRLAQVSVDDDQSLAEHLSAIDSQIRGLFKDVRHDAPPPEVPKPSRPQAQAPKKNTAPVKAKAFTPPVASTPTTPAVLLRRAVMGLALLGGAVFYLAPSDVEPVRELSEAQRKALSPVLSSAATAGEHSALMGAVDPTKWEALGDGERATVARELAASVKAGGYTSFMVLSQDEVVIHIQDGAVVYLR